MTRKSSLSGAGAPLPDAAAETIRSLADDAVRVAADGGPGAGPAEDASKAAAYLAKGMISETLRECGRLLDRNKNHPAARLFSAICFFKRGDLAQAERQFRNYLALQKQVPSINDRVQLLLESFAVQKSREHKAGSSRQATPSPPQISRVGLAGRRPGAVLNVNWVITQHCNFTCSYCTVYDNRPPYPSLEQLTSAVDKIARLGRPDVRVVLTGGEPTIHPGYIPFIRHMTGHLPNLSVLRTETNLSRTPRFYRELADAMRDHASILAFHCSIHFEFTDIGKFLANAKFLSRQGIDVQVRLLAHPEHMAAVKRVAGELVAERNAHLTFIVKTIRKHFGKEPDDRYTQEDLDWLVDVHDEDDIERTIAVDFVKSGSGAAPVERQFFSPNEMIARHLNRFKGMGCLAGVEMLSIGATGALDRAVCFRGMPGERPNIYGDQEIPAAFLQPLRCPFDACGCPEDIAISKFAIGPDGRALNVGAG